jgi:hypothetical protein
MGLNAPRHFGPWNESATVRRNPCCYGRLNRRPPDDLGAGDDDDGGGDEADGGDVLDEPDPESSRNFRCGAGAR